MSAGPQVRKHGYRFHRLAETHLVTDDHLALDKSETSAETLVPAQRCREVLPLQLQRPDRFDNVIRQIAVSVFGDYVVAFEVTSILLVVAVVGTVMLTRRVKSGKDKS